MPDAWLGHKAGSQRAFELRPMKFSLKDVRHDQTGFEQLVRLHQTVNEYFLEAIEIDMSNTSWFDADMSSPLGGILYSLGSSPNSIVLTNFQDGVERILSKNGFLSSYGRNKIPDTWGTTIPYQRFDVEDDRYFGSYIEKEFVQRPEMPRMSEGLLKKFRESIFEIFSNAVLHSKTSLGIFSCGQYFPKKDRLDFSVTDLGIGMRQNIKDSLHLDLDPEEAVEWACQGSNTTKRGPIPGGLGLKLLREFIGHNGGSIQIVSDAGYWRFKDGQSEKHRLAASFPGTVVTIEINTADSKSYVLSSELSDKDIF